MALGPASAFGQGEAETLSASFRKAARRVLPAVVTVRPIGVASPFEALPGPRPFGGGPGEFGPDLPRREPGGSGLIIDAAKGYVLTNDHVVQGASRVVVTLADGRERTAEQVRRDPKSDLALLVIDRRGLSEAEWGSSDALETGDWVLAIGQPFGLSDTVTAGIVSGKGRGIGMAMYEDLIQTDAAINPGNSGGPLVNLKGEVVGINTAIKTLGGGYEGVGFAVPAARARRVAADLAEHGRVRRAYLGIQIGRVDRARAARVDLPGAVAIHGVTAGSPGAGAGLRPGDVITGLQGKPVRGQGSLQSTIEVAPVGEPMSLTIDRDGKRLDVEVRPEEQPETFGLGESPSGRPRVLPPFPNRRGPYPPPPEDFPPGDARGPTDDPGPILPPRREQLESRAPGRFPALGLRLGEPTPSLARRFHLGDSPTGLIVLGVEPGSPADRGGLEVGLLITDVANRKVESLTDFRAALAGRTEGRDLLFRVLKDSKAEFRVILEPGETRTPDKPPTSETPVPAEGQNHSLEVPASDRRDR
ncbi:MAG: trypsin-like peptidase domain-containing protein [Singulisphaera sp.]